MVVRNFDFEYGKRLEISDRESFSNVKEFSLKIQYFKAVSKFSGQRPYLNCQIIFPRGKKLKKIFTSIFFDIFDSNYLNIRF